ncbi:hypothetical protein WMW72_23200 [Paenibacillus filicis]|uniref:Uncharacterized protein n=1 Tax=Paenibacillus filicis TaxID=669464 RepID=A0ABU9DRW0_9BACL
MIKAAGKGLDQQAILDILLEVCERGQTIQSLGTKEIVQDIVVRLKPYYVPELEEA